MATEATGVPAAGSEIPDDLYRLVVEALSAVTYVFGRSEQRFLYVSPQSEAVLGLPHDEMMIDGAERVRMFHPDDRGRVLQDMAKLEETGRGTRNTGSSCRTARIAGCTIEHGRSRRPTTGRLCGSVS